jgi:hypothetical protein
MLRGSSYRKSRLPKLHNTPGNLKYPKRSLIYNGTDEDEFLYCLPDDKEISVYREMADSIGYPKLDLGLSIMSKDQLADNLAYNSLKVRTFSL